MCVNCRKRGLQLYKNTYIVLQHKSDSQLCRADPVNAGPWRVQMFDGRSVSGPRDAQPIPTAQPFGVQPLRPQQHQGCHQHRQQDLLSQQMWLLLVFFGQSSACSPEPRPSTETCQLCLRWPGALSAATCRWQSTPKTQLQARNC